MPDTTDNIISAREYSGLLHVFRDRRHAGELLAGMLANYRDSNALVVGIPAGGVPVAAALAERLGLEMDIAIVKKITPPDNTEYGYGALAWDGTMEINPDAVLRLGLSEDDVNRGIELTRARVDARSRHLRQNISHRTLQDRTVILVDDGLATGITYRTAIAALKKQGASKIIGAVPTAFEHSARKVAKNLDALYCANLRSGMSYAVADAYQKWYDVPESEVMELLQHLTASPSN